MRAELVQQLNKFYSFVRIMDDYGYPIISCGDGWYALIAEFCKEIELYKERVAISRIKEKYGVLDISCKSVSTELDKAIFDLAAKYTKLSAGVCEKCGNPGKRQRINGVYYKTLCKDCEGVSTIEERA